MKNYIISIIFNTCNIKCIGIDVNESKIDKIPGKDRIELFINNL